MTSPPIDQYLDKLNTLPPAATENLLTIRRLDKELLKMQIEIDAAR